MELVSVKCHDRTSNEQKTQTKPEISKLHTVRLITSKETTLSGPDDQSHHKALTVRSTCLSGVGQHMQSVKRGSYKQILQLDLKPQNAIVVITVITRFLLLLLLLLCIRG